MKPAAEGEGGEAGGKAARLAPISTATTTAASSSSGPAPSEKVVHSRSQALFRSGTKALGDALKQLVPRSTAFMSSDAELWDFLCSLKHEFSPVILRSKDVYGYASCRAVVPDLPRGWGARETRAGKRRTAAAAANKKGKSGGGRGRGAKKRRKDAGACEDPRPDPPRWTPGEPEAHPDPPPTLHPPVKVRGDIWKKRNLEAARRRAQRLLRVNLEPVVRLRRIPGSTCC